MLGAYVKLESRRLEMFEDLIVRLEQAKGPSRKIDAEIAVAAGWRVKDGGYNPNYANAVGTPPGARGNHTIPRYTSSLDEALTLVPEGWPFHVWRDSTENGDEPFAQVNYETDVAAATPVLALCIAALKARTTVPAKAPGDG